MRQEGTTTTRRRSGSARAAAAAPAVAALALAAWLVPGAAMAQDGRALRPPSAFAGIAERQQRSAALFVEAGRVLRHPRCVNCHAAGDRPSQGETGRPHQPPVRGGRDGDGVAGLRCSACHQVANYDAVGMPGDPNWHLAPASMSWEGEPLGEICARIRDPGRNGGRSLADITEHVARDSLVAWAWSPGAGREPAPGTQKAFGALIKAWVDTGAACPGG